MLSLMAERRYQKLDGWHVETVKKFPPLAQLDTLTYLGSFAWTQPHSKIKYIKSPHIYNLGGGDSTPSDIARDYIACKFNGERQRCNSTQYKKLIRNKKHAPLYAEPVTGLRATYLDMKSAYWQILMLGGWDVEYSPNSFLSVRSSVLDFPCPHVKLARNNLVSMGLPSKGTLWHPENGLQRLRGSSTTINLVLWGFAMDVLHSIAYEMIERAGAVYVNTDGYIVPRYMVDEAFAIADEWNITLVPKHNGMANVRGAGDYDIENKRSSRPRSNSRYHKYIEPPNIKWLKSRWNHFSHRIDMTYNPMYAALL